MWLFTPTAPGTAFSAASVFSRSSPSLIPCSSAPGPGFWPFFGSIGRWRRISAWRRRSAATTCRRLVLEGEDGVGDRHAERRQRLEVVDARARGRRSPAPRGRRGAAPDARRPGSPPTGIAAGVPGLDVIGSDSGRRRPVARRMRRSRRPHGWRRVPGEPRRARDRQGLLKRYEERPRRRAGRGGTGRSRRISNLGTRAAGHSGVGSWSSGWLRRSPGPPGSDQAALGSAVSGSWPSSRRTPRRRIRSSIGVSFSR